MDFKRFLPNLPTILIVVLLIAVQQVWASPLAERFSAPSEATSKTTINYQGYLTDSAGAPVNDTLSMVFRIYNVESTGTALWAETQNNVVLSDGLFSVLLGSETALDESIFSANPSLWLGITVGSDDEMAPRELLSSAPFAIASTGIPVGAVIPWWRPTADTPVPSEQFAIADGSVVDDTSSPFHGETLPDLTDSFIMGVSAENIGDVGGQNTVNLSHRHQVSSHAHSIPSHSHSVSGSTGEVKDAWDGGYYTEAGDGKRFADLVYGGYSAAWYYRHNHSVSLNSGAWSGTSGGSSPYTNYQQGNTENRPAYVGLLYLVRIK